jgi:hypothetical protein
MNERSKRIAYWVTLFVLIIVVLPVIAAAATTLTGPLDGRGQVGSAFLALVEHPKGPMQVLQKALIPLLGFVSLPVLWRWHGGYALGIIGVCMAGVIATLILWFRLNDIVLAADLWQNSANTGLNGVTFLPALTDYSKLVVGLLVADILAVFGIKGIELLKGP